MPPSTPPCLRQPSTNGANPSAASLRQERPPMSASTAYASGTASTSKSGITRKPPMDATGSRERATVFTSNALGASMRRAEAPWAASQSAYGASRANRTVFRHEISPLPPPANQTAAANVHPPPQPGTCAPALRWFCSPPEAAAHPGQKSRCGRFRCWPEKRRKPAHRAQKP